jgi:hypothetical protein
MGLAVILIAALLDSAVAELCDRKTVICPSSAMGHDVSRVGYCVCHLLTLLPDRDAFR